MAEGAGDVAGLDVGLLIRAASSLLDVSPLAVKSLSRVHAGRWTDWVRRFDIAVEGKSTAQVIVRPCSPVERQVLALLEGVHALPRVHIEETAVGQTFDVVMLDPGQSLLGLDDRSKRLAAEALSEVHARFLGRDAQLGDLPKLTTQYVRDVIVSGCWQDSWDIACSDARFQEVFGSWTESVEASAARLPSDLVAFSDGLQLNTLTHTNIHSGRILDGGDRALIIDWSQARCAPLFLDLGDTFDTVDSGWIYRDALAARGWAFDDDVFGRGHLLALRFAGIRYLASWLKSWLTAPQEWNRSGLQRTLAMAAGITSGAGP